MSYKSVSYKPKKKLKNDLEDPEFKQAWEALEDEFAALDALLTARQNASRHYRFKNTRTKTLT